MIFSNLKQDHTKLIISLGFLAVFALMILVTWLSMATLNTVNQNMSTLIRDTEQKTSRAYNMRDVIRIRSEAVQTLKQITDIEKRREIFIALGEQTEEYTNCRLVLASLGANEREREILKKLNQVDDRLNIVYQKASDMIHAVNNTRADGLIPVLHEIHLQELVLLNHLNDLVILEKTLAQEALQTNQDTYKTTKQLLLLIVFAAFALSLMISINVTGRVSRANLRIAHLANHDDLTNLRNRRSFEQQLKATIATAQRSNQAYGLLYLDMDRFKIVNDTCGHNAGDQLLIQLTELLSARLRSGDVFARIGGDEFAIIAAANSFKDIIQLAEDLRTIASEYTFHYAEQTFKVSLSIGVVPVHGSEFDIESILVDVDSACYVAKQSGRNRVHVTQDDDVEVVKYRNDIAGVQCIRQALEENRLDLFYQPVFRIEQQGLSMEYCEILLRIRSENGELFSPAKFIPLAEKYNVMTQIDRWVFNNVMDWVAEHYQGMHLPKFLVNLSGLSFIDEEFLNYITARLQASEFDPSCIAFEITETATVNNLNQANVFIRKIRKLGCEIALDNFGSGISTFAYLKKLPIDCLKIDGALVENMAEDSVDREMVQAINNIGHSVGAKTIAESVESDETLRLLRELGVDYAQGYGLRMPSSLAALVDELIPRIPGNNPDKAA